MKYRIGHTFLKGNSTLKRFTIIDIHETGNSFVVKGEDLKVQEITIVEDTDIYAHFHNGINQPETQDVSDRFTLEPIETWNQTEKYQIGQKVTFKAELKEATLEIQGFVIRNFWSDYYLVTELGVSVPNRYWKVSSDRISIS